MNIVLSIAIALLLQTGSNPANDLVYASEEFSKPHTPRDSVYMHYPSLIGYPIQSKTSWTEPWLKADNRPAWDEPVTETLVTGSSDAERETSHRSQKSFRFMIIRPDGTSLPGHIYAVDRQVGRDIAVYPSGTIITGDEFPARKLIFVCGVFGYKPVEKTLARNTPGSFTGAVQGSDGVWSVPFALKRLEKGDVCIMYNVVFYENAVVMQPSSKKDLDGLVEMMTENPDYVIRIHAHCNGKAKRIMAVPADRKEYFNIHGANRVAGTARELTALRAAAVLSYLTQHGITEKRIRIHPWGGSLMHVPPDDPASYLNDRIEIEIIRD